MHSAGNGYAGGAQELRGQQPDENWLAVNIMALAWAGVMSSLTCVIASSAVVVRPFSPWSAWNTLPLSCMFLSIAAGQLLLPVKLHVMGRRHAYLCGAVAGAIGCSIIGLACVSENFTLVCVGCCLQGLATADGQNYRFGAMLLAPSCKEKVAGRVLVGGVLGAFIGPGLITRARKLVPGVDFAGIFILCTCMHVLVFVFLCGVQFPEPSAKSANVDGPPPRTLLQLISQPVCAAAILTTTMSFVVMLLVMAPTPLAMQDAGHSFTIASLTMMSHMVLMYAPSVLTAKMIVTTGPLSVVILGCVLNGLCNIVNIFGQGVEHFAVALSLLGVGWNCLFLSATAMLSKVCTPKEGPKVQAVNDCIAGFLSGAATLISAIVIEKLGWKEDNVIDMGLSAFTVLANVLLALLADVLLKKQKGSHAFSAHASKDVHEAEVRSTVAEHEQQDCTVQTVCAI